MSELPTHIEWLLARSFVYAARRISSRCTQRWAEALSETAWRVMSLHRRLAMANTRLAFPEKSQAETELLARMSFRSFAHTLIESLRMPRVMPDVTWLGTDELLSSIAEGRSGIVLAAHIGNWELAAAALASRGARLHLIVASPTNARVAGLMSRLRRSWGVFPHPREGPLRPVVQALRNRELVGTAIDQWPSRNHVSATFFGRATPFASGLFELAIRMAVPLHAITALRAGHPASDSFQISTRLVWDGVEPDVTAEMLVWRWVKMLEQTVRENPEQYLWMHDRWKLKSTLV